jgi:DNA-binding transcriptional ArsR family regulator
MPDGQVSAMRATAHPIRLRILSLLTGASLSAADIARELDLTHANASYHVRVLASAGLVVEAGEEKIRGGIAKRFRHPWEQQDPHTPRPGDRDRALFVRALADELIRRFALRRPGSTGASTDAEVWLAPEVWAQAMTLVEHASYLVHAEAKTPRTPGTIHVNMTSAMFEMAEPERDAEGGRR